MLHILDDLQDRANFYLGTSESPFERKKRIIGQNLYGVDVMEWAGHVAELRLWLALIINAEFTAEELHVRRDPLLPHFTFKIRCGDALVQEIGDIGIGHVRTASGIPAALKAKITKLKTEKFKFYNNDSDCVFRDSEQIKQEELRVFRSVLDSRLNSLQDDITQAQKKLATPVEKQLRIDGSLDQTGSRVASKGAEFQKELDSLNDKLARVRSARHALKNDSQPPFAWDIAFVEVFEGDRKGFDIVIGNPPYVRQESISDPRLTREDVTPGNKKLYREKLARAIYQGKPGA